MAITIPQNLTGIHSATQGEKKVFDYLKKNLGDNYLVYYNIPICGYFPDFIILGEDLGLFVLEVKDWYLKDIKLIRKDEIILNGKDKPVKNPILQARGYALKILKTIKNHSYIQSKKEFNLKWGCGVLFTNIKRSELKTLSAVNKDILDMLGLDFIFTAEDLSDECLLDKLKTRMTGHYGKIELTKNDIDFLRSVIYPEIVINKITDSKNIIKVLDENQEQIARNLDLGHYLIRGVAGSGKTIILVARAKFLSRMHPDWNILFLCYNKSLCSYLKEQLKQYKNVNVMTYHGWCIKQLKTAKLLSESEEKLPDDYFDTMIPQKLLDAYSKNLLKKRYDAILVDEGQDFDSLWYKSIVAALNKNTNCLLIAIDSSQTIYNRKVSWKSLGIDVVGRGRTRIFKKNYRNTKQILDVAYNIIKEMDENKEMVCEEDFDYIVPELALREGPSPQLKKFTDIEYEKKFLLEWVKNKIKETNNSEEILVLCPTKKDLQSLSEYLTANKINHEFITDRKFKSKVVISTIHSSKGLEADNVLIFDTQKIEKIYNLYEGKRLLYIGMTRSREELCICHIGECRILTTSNSQIN